MRPIPSFDPMQKKGPFQRATEAAVASAPGTWVHKHVVARVEPAMVRASGKHIQVGGGPRVNLIVRGRKSGEPRTTTLLYFTRGDEVIVMASNYGGEGHPAWYLNLAAAKEC